MFSQKSRRNERPPSAPSKAMSGNRGARSDVESCSSHRKAASCSGPTNDRSRASYAAKARVKSPRLGANALSDAKRLPEIGCCRAGDIRGIAAKEWAPHPNLSSSRGVSEQSPTERRGDPIRDEDHSRAARTCQFRSRMPTPTGERSSSSRNQRLTRTAGGLLRGRCSLAMPGTRRVNVRADSADSRALGQMADVLIARWRGSRACSTCCGTSSSPWSAVARRRKYISCSSGSARRRRGLVHAALPLHVPFRSGRAQFVPTMMLTWWDAVRAVWPVLVGMFRLVGVALDGRWRSVLRGEARVEVIRRSRSCPSR